MSKIWYPKCWALGREEIERWRTDIQQLMGASDEDCVQIDVLCDMALDGLAARMNALRNEAIAPARTAAPEATPHEWRDPKDKPPNLPGEHHSQDVLLKMNPRRMLGDDDHGIRIGHVSCGHWRPSGGNGNFDADVLGWMPLPSYPLPQPLPTISTKGETP